MGLLKKPADESSIRFMLTFPVERVRISKALPSDTARMLHCWCCPSSRSLLFRQHVRLAVLQCLLRSSHAEVEKPRREAKRQASHVLLHRYRYESDVRS